MAGKVNVYNLGALGVNLVQGHIHMKDGELLQCQNAMASPIGAQVALVKRPGMDLLTAAPANGEILHLQSFLQRAYQGHDALLGQTWRHVRWADAINTFCAVRTSGTNRVITSSDALTWTERTAALQLSWNSVDWAPSLGLFCACAGGSVGGTDKLMTSPDGITWTIRSAATANADWQGIAWSPTLSLFAVVNETGATALNTSPDGITWTSRVGVFGGWRRLVWLPTLNLFLKVGWTNAGTVHFGTSPDGINWTDRTVAGTTLFNDAVYVPSLGLVVAVGNLAANSIATSPDAITWTLRTGPTSNLWSIEYASELGLLVAQGSESYFMSENGIDWWEAAGSALNATRGSDLAWSSDLELFGACGSNGVEAFEQV